MDVITANPKTAGVARWNFFALWGHRLDKGEDAALDYTTKARPSAPPSALQLFLCTFLHLHTVLCMKGDLSSVYFSLWPLTPVRV